MKTAISIPDPVFESAEDLARRLAVSRSQLYTRAVEAYVHAHRDEGVTEAINAVCETEDTSLDPLTAQLQAASLPRDEW